MHASPFEIDCDLSLTEKHVFSLFARYPEITFDQDNSDTKQAPDRRDQVTNQLDSSPISTSEEANKSCLSNSTAQTTPLRPLYLLQPQRSDASTVAGYLHQVRLTNLPEECRLCFTSLAQSIGTISTGMVPSTNGRYRINNTYFMDQCTTLLGEVRKFVHRTKDQLKQTTDLASLVVFKVAPSDDMLWAIYRQRALLIIRFTAPPSPCELQLIQKLASLYNTTIYNPTQLLYDDDEIEVSAMRIINQLYDTLFTWLSEYRNWCNAMKDLKQKYMQPLMDRIMKCQPLYADVKNISRAKSNAEKAIADPKGPRMLPMDERTIQELNLSARREGAVIKRKARFKRERTI